MTFDPTFVPGPELPDVERDHGIAPVPLSSDVALPLFLGLRRRRGG
jgi:hypothetical protein